MENEYLKLLENDFLENANSEIAKGQHAYLRHQFKFYGLKTPLRREIQKPFLLKSNLPSKTRLDAMVRRLWDKPEREFQYFGQELAFKYVRDIQLDDLELYEYMITNKSWWDTVDFIATKLVSSYFKKYPENIDFKVNEWIDSDNMWLQRTALIFQLKWKEQLDTEVLKRTILALNGTQEFFINKAIGWALREYSRTNSDWVLEFTDGIELHPLSRREALRLANR